MFRTVKFQIGFVLTILIVVIVFQTYMSRQNHTLYSEAQTLSQQTVEKVNLVRELEKDVLDIQRLVLIFKQTASSSVLGRFTNIFAKIDKNLTDIKSLTEREPNAEDFHDIIGRMRTHLESYKANFETVVEGRSRREDLYQVNLVKKLNDVLSYLNEFQKINDVSDAEAINITRAQYALSDAQNILFQYVVDPTPNALESFRNDLNFAKGHLSQENELTMLQRRILPDLDVINSDFVQLAQITRGYLYLVNVVMAGSANEFLFLSKELNEQVSQSQQRVDAQIRLDAKRAQKNNSIFAAVSISMTLLCAIFVIYRVTLPINVLTELFNDLARDKRIDQIPFTERRDEVGELASAAEVFRQKNLQTIELLDNAKELNKKQELLNRKLAVSSMKAEQATAYKSIFLANMSHEIRTPMNGIIGLIDIVLKSELTDTQRESLRKVEYSTQILLNLINDILDFSKIEAGKLDIEDVPFSPHSLFENLLANISVKAREKNLNLIFYCDPALPNSLLGDSLRLNQVLLNLCTNAVKFTQTGEIKIEVRFKRTTDGAITLLFSVQDTGIGMDEKQLAGIFTPFTQADGTTSRQFGGTGLGLTIVKQLVELMNGEVNAYSELDHGSRFDVSVALKVLPNCEPCLNLKIPYSLNFLSPNRSYITPKAYLDAIDTHFLDHVYTENNTWLDRLDEQSALIIDVDNIASHKKLVAIIERAKRRHVHVGLVTNTQPSTLPNLLAQKWQMPVISQPFTALGFAQFICEVCDIECVAKVQREAKSRDVDIQLDGHVLLVEDNNINQAVAGEMLKQLGLSHDIAEDGLQAVTKINNSPHYDLILMDIQMPNMDGYEATQLIRHNGHEDLVICGLSANAMKSDKEKAMAVGMNDYLAKPIKLNALSAVLAKYLAQKTR